MNILIRLNIQWQVLKFGNALSTTLIVSQTHMQS